MACTSQGTLFPTSTCALHQKASGKLLMIACLPACNLFFLRWFIPRAAQVDLLGLDGCWRHIHRRPCGGAITREEEPDSSRSALVPASSTGLDRNQHARTAAMCADPDLHMVACRQTVSVSGWSLVLLRPIYRIYVRRMGHSSCRAACKGNTSRI
jgi:hypothetical protein